MKRSSGHYGFTRRQQKYSKNKAYRQPSNKHDLADTKNLGQVFNDGIVAGNHHHCDHDQ